MQSEKANLMILFDKYLPTCLDKLRFGFKKITPVPEVTVIQTILYLLECLLTEKTTPPDSPKELYELYFVFACFWAFGGAMFQDQVSACAQPGLWVCPERGPLTPLFGHSWWIIESSSANGGPTNSKRSSSPHMGPSSTTTWTLTLRSSCPGRTKCPPSS